MRGHGVKQEQQRGDDRKHYGRIEVRQPVGMDTDGRHWAKCVHVVYKVISVKGWDKVHHGVQEDRPEFVSRVYSWHGITSGGDHGEYNVGATQKVAGGKKREIR